MAMNIKDIFAGFNTAVKERAVYEEQWRAIGDVIRPLRQGIREEKTKGEDRRRKIFDGEPERSMDRLGADLYSNLTNPASRWFRLAAPDPDLNAFRPVSEWLFNVGEIMHQSLRPAHSAFYSQMPIMWVDYPAFGTGYFWSERQPGTDNFIDVVDPIGEMYLRTNALGKVDTRYREMKMTVRQIGQKFPDAPFKPAFRKALEDPARNNDEMRVVHAVLPNEEFERGKFGLTGKAMQSIYILKQDATELSRRGYDESPGFAPRWDLVANEKYGRGIGHKMLADALMLQAQNASLLKSGQLAAEPTLIAADQTVIQDPVRLSPGFINYGGMNRAGKPLVQALNLSGNTPINIELIAQTRDAVKNAAFFFLTSLSNRTGISEQEFLTIDEEKLRLMSPMIGRSQDEFLSPFITRRFNMLHRMNALPLPPPELEGMTLDIRYQGPMETAQKARDGANTMRYARAIGELATVVPDAVDNLDGDAAAQVLSEAFNPNPTVRRDAREVEEIRETRAEQDRQAAALAAANSVADTAQKGAAAFNTGQAAA
ncbi:MAG: portal protein [Planctomycetota bacterium]